MLMGVGGGFILVPAMLYILGMSASVVVGTSLFQILFVTMVDDDDARADHQGGRHRARRRCCCSARSRARRSARSSRRRPSPRCCAWSLAAIVLLVALRMAVRARRAARRDLHGDAAVSARSRCAAARVLRAHRRSAIRSWCPRSRSTRSRCARASPAPSCCCSARSSIPTARRAAARLRHRRRAQGPDRADPCCARKRKIARHLDQRRQHRVPLRAVVLRGRLARARSTRSSMSGPRRSTSSGSTSLQLSPTGAIDPGGAGALHRRAWST